MSLIRNGSCRCDWCGRLSRNQLGQYTRGDGSAGYIHSPDWDKDGAQDICEECSEKRNPETGELTDGSD
jgi:hypothetical protein